MIGTRYEGYDRTRDELPLVLGYELERSAIIYSKEKNWHEELELQLCEDGCGEVLLNGERISFEKNEIVAINPNVIHYTGTKERLIYTCIIIKNDFLELLGINANDFVFESRINDSALLELIGRLKEIYKNHSDPLRVAKIYEILSEIIIKLIENHSAKKEEKTQTVNSKSFETVKAAIRFIRKNYGEQITLDLLAKQLCADKYALCREFKKFSGQTVIEYVNNYRCQKAADLITEGYTVAEAARECGFENLSFFTKTFKKNTGRLPSSYKNG